METQGAGSATVDRTYGGLLRRGVAYLIDTTISIGLFAGTQLLLFTPIRTALGISDSWFRSGLNTQLYTMLTISVPVWLYFTVAEWRWQTTIGKALLKLRVVSAANSSRVSFGQALARTAVKLLPWEIAHLSNNLPEPLWYASEPQFRPGFALTGILMGAYMVVVYLHEKHRGLHDLLAGTAVVKKE